MESSRATQEKTGWPSSDSEEKFRPVRAVASISARLTEERTARAGSKKSVPSLSPSLPTCIQSYVGIRIRRKVNKYSNYSIRIC